MNVIEVTELTRTYSGKTPYTAVAGASFTVAAGEVFGLLGTNGAGKTSSLEVIEGLARPTDGTVNIYGLDPYADRRALRPELGIMLQSGGLPGQLTVTETMRMWAGTMSTPRGVDEVLDEVRLTHRSDVKVSALSGGEQRRLDLACALLGDPSVVFLDEPTTGLDPESRRNTWNLLTGLKERGVTMILTTHYLEEAELLCDRIAIMHDARIVRQGTLAELVEEESSRITFRTPEAVPEVPELPELPGTRVDHHDGDYVIHTRRLQNDTHQLLDWAAGNDVSLDGFSATPASLEAVFMSVAGKDAKALQQ